VLVPKTKIEAAVVGFEALVQTIEDQFPKAARRPLGLETRYISAGVQAVAEAAEVAGAVAGSVEVEVVGRPVDVDAQSGIGCCTE
jgi:hypothetical protein